MDLHESGIIGEPFKRTSTTICLNFLFLILNNWKDFKVLSHFMQKWIQPPAFSDHGLHRILSSYWLAHFYLMKKSTKGLLYFGLDCEMMKFFTFKPQPKEQLISLPHFWSKVRWKRSRFEHMQTVIQTSWRIRGLFAWSGSKLGSCFKYSALKLKNQKPIAVDVLFNAYTLGYSDFHNLMRFTSKKMPYDILKNVCKKSFSIG